MNRVIVSPDSVFFEAGGQYTAWSRHMDRAWLVDQFDTRPRPAGGSGREGTPAPPVDLYRWPGFPLRITDAPSADVPPLRADGAEHAAPRALRGNAHDGAGEAVARHTAGPRPVSLQAVGRIMRLTWPWSSR